MATLPLQSRMSLSTSYSSTARHRLVEFGDGYIQRTPLGINQPRRTISVTHENLSATDSGNLIGFYQARQAYGDAVEISANALLTSSGKFYLESFDVQMSDDSKRTVTATMVEVYDL